MEIFKDHTEREADFAPESGDVEMDDSEGREVQVSGGQSQDEPADEPTDSGEYRVYFSHIGWLYSPDRHTRWKGRMTHVLSASEWEQMKNNRYTELVERV